MKTLRYSILLVMLSIAWSMKIGAQTTIFLETFNSGTGAGWQLNSGDLGSDTVDNVNKWYINNVYTGAGGVPNTVAQPAGVTGYPNSNYLHISCDTSASLNANFITPNASSAFAKMTAPINTTGYISVNVNIWYLLNTLCGGSGMFYYSIDGGHTWVPVLAKLGLSTVNWYNVIYTNAAWNNQADLRFAFQFTAGTTCTGYKYPSLAVDEIKVTGIACATTITGETGVPACIGMNNGSITITATGSGTLSYIIKSGTVSDTNTTGIFTNLTPGTYTVSVNNGSCSYPGTPVVVGGASSFSATNNGATCSGSTLTISATNIPGVTYSWTGPNGFTSTQPVITFTNVPVADSGTYTVIATFPAGCAADTASTHIRIDSCNVLYSENFDSTVTNSWSMNTTDVSSNSNDESYWLINNVYPGGLAEGVVQVINTPNEPSAVYGSPNSHYMHITTGSWSGVYNANFVDPGTGNVFSKMNAPIVTTGRSNVTLSFWYLCNGGCPAKYYGKLFYSIDGGHTWVQEGGNYSNISAWTKASITDPAFNNRADLRFAFQWVQGSGTCGLALDPAWAVDDILVTGSPCSVNITGQTAVNPCSGSTGSITITATGTGTLTYTITKGGVATSNHTGIFTGLAAGTYSISVSDTNCSLNGTAITLSNPAAIALTSNGPVCSGKTLSLHATNVIGATYSWAGPNGFTADTANTSIPGATYADSGTYTLIVNIAGCGADTFTTYISVDSCPTPQSLYFEDFDSTTTNSWSLNTGDQGSTTHNTNMWYINNVYLGGLFGLIINTPNEPAGVTGSPQSKYLHISSGPAVGVYNANFEAPASGNVFTKMNEPVNTTGYSNVTLSFWYLCRGGCPNNYYGKLFYSIDGGHTWIQEGGKYMNVGNWLQATVTDPAFDNRADLRFAYQWIQSGNCWAAADPAWAVDDIEVTGVMCPVHIDSITSINPCLAGNTGSISIYTTGVGPLTYAISNGAVTDTNSTGLFLNDLAPGFYTVTVSTPKCSTYGNGVTIIGQSAVVAAGNSPVCVGGTINLSATSVAGATYQWSGPNSFSSSAASASITGASVADSGTYTLQVTYPGCSDTVTTSVTVAVDSCPAIDTIWPGDANGDGIANNQDYLAIGVAFGQTGVTRAGATNSWTAQTCGLWANSFTGGVNMNHADCNGDGVVNASDTVAVVANYGLTHAKNLAEQRSPGNPPLYLQLTNHLLQTGGTATVSINLGDSTLPASDIYGIAFSVIYDGTLVDPASINTNYQTSWMGTVGKDMMVMEKSLSNYQLDFAVTRTDQQTRSNIGQIGQLSFNLVNQLNGADTLAQLPMYVYGITAIDNNGNYVPLDTKGDTLIVQAKTTTGINNTNSGDLNVTLFPNPATGSIFLTATQNIGTYIIYNPEGQEVARREGFNAQQATIDLTGYAKGIYILQATIGQQKVVRRFAVF